MNIFISARNSFQNILYKTLPLMKNSGSLDSIKRHFYQWGQQRKGGWVNRLVQLLTPDITAPFHQTRTWIQNPGCRTLAAPKVPSSGSLSFADRQFGTVPFLLKKRSSGYEESWNSPRNGAFDAIRRVVRRNGGDGGGRGGSCAHRHRWSTQTAKEGERIE